MRRRTFVKTTAGLGTVLLAGCSGTDSDPDDGSTERGTFRLLISDQPMAIDDFDSLNVTLSTARVFQADEDDEITSDIVTDTVTENTTVPDDTGADDTEDPDEGFVEFDLDSVTVDLTEVKGDRAVSVLEGELDEGRYSGIELRVAGTEGIVDGEAVDVMVPSDRLRIVKPFQIGAEEELDFVFDINVVQKGPTGGYNLLPVIGKSGVVGEDVEVEEVDTQSTETPTGTNTTAEA